MKTRVMAAIAAFGIVVAMSGFGTVAASADEVPEDTVLVEETTSDETTSEETTSDDTSTEESAPEETEGESSTDEIVPETPVEEPGDEGTTDETATDETSTGESTEAPIQENGPASRVQDAAFAIAAINVTICHATPPATAKNGWNDITVDANAFNNPNGHDGHAADIIPVVPNVYPGKNLDTVYPGGVTGQQLLELYGCVLPPPPDNDVEVPEEPSAEAQACLEGQVVLGSITVDFTGVAGKIQYTITGPNGYNHIVDESEPTTIVPVAGLYTVTAVGINGWEVEGEDEFELTVEAADCEFVTICHAKLGDSALLGWNELTVTQAQALDHAEDHTADIVPPFGDFPGQNLDEYFFVFWTGQEILSNDCDTPYFQVDICHAVDGDSPDDGWVPMTVGPVLLGFHILAHDADIIPAKGEFPGKNLDTLYEGWTGQQILDNDCLKTVTVPDGPDWGNEYCYNGETQPGAIGVDYTGVVDRLQYRITGPNGYDNVVPASNGWVYTDLPAGDYVVHVEPLNGWVLEGGEQYPAEITIGAAINCGCAVDDNDRIAALVIVENPVCAEAEVSVTPPTCEAAAKLVPGATLHSEFEAAVYVDNTYSIVAVADPGFRFLDGPGVSDDGAEKSFTGDLPVKLTNCGGLAYTGSTFDGTLPWLAVLGLLLGVGGVVVAHRRNAMK